MTNVALQYKATEDKKIKHKIGNWYKRGARIYVLITDGERIILVNPVTGLPWSDPEGVMNQHDISDKEFEQITDCTTFEYVENIKIQEV